MILVHSLECDEGWVMYGGHDYMMNTTRVSQPEAMVCHTLNVYGR